MRADTIIRASRRDPAVVLASFGANLLSLVVPLSMIHLYDRIIPNDGYESLTLLALMVAGAIVAEVLLRTARRVILERAGETFEVVTYNAAFDTILKADPAIGDKITRGRLSRSISAVERLRAMHTGETALAILDLPFAMLFLAVIALISPLIGALVFAILAATFCVLRLTRRRVRLLQDQRKDVEERRHSFLAETLAGVEVVKGMHIENAMLRRYERLMGRAAAIGVDTTRNTHTAQGFAATVGAFSPIIVACAGASLVIVGDMTVGALAAVILLTGRIIQPALRVEAFLAGMVETGQERRDIEDVLTMPKLHSGHLTLDMVETIELEDVTSAAGVYDSFGFRGVDLSLRRGDCVEIVGPDRNACTAFFSLLLGEAELLNGRFDVNGRDVLDYRLADRQRQFAYISRDNRLMSGTLLDNLTGFRPIEHRDEAIKLARQLGIDDVLATSAEGYDLRVGSGAKVALSTSLADSVVIAGALVGKPGLLLFDQANASLDRNADGRLLRALAEGCPDRITVIYSNRPSYQRLANRTLDITPFVYRPEVSMAQDAVAS